MQVQEESSNSKVPGEALNQLQTHNSRIITANHYQSPNQNQSVCVGSFQTQLHQLATQTEIIQYSPAFGIWL